MIKERRKFYDDKYRSCNKYRIDRAIRSYFRAIIKRNLKSSKYEKILGYSIQEFKEYISQKFEPEMSFDNYGEWHIDHSVGRYHFEYCSMDCAAFITCYSLRNLQSLWKKDNLSKKKKVKLND